MGKRKKVERDWSPVEIRGTSFKHRLFQVIQYTKLLQWKIDYKYFYVCDNISG